MSWKDLDIKLKAELIKLGILSGITDKNKIIQMYDLSIGLPTLIRKFEEGGLVNPTLEEKELATGLDRLIQDYQVQDPTALFGVKTLEDSYKVSEAIRKYLLAKLAVEKEKEDIIKNDVEKFINKDTFASPKPAVIPIMKSGTLASQNSNEVLELLGTTLLLLQEEDKNKNNSNEKNKLNTDVSTERSLLFDWNKDSYPKKNSWEQVAEIAKPNIEEYLKSVQERIKKQKELEEQQRKIQELIRLDSIQKNVLDSLTKELKPNTVEALSNPVEVDKNTIQEVQDIITPKLEKGTPEYYADSTAKHINRVLDEHFLQNPTLYSLLTDNFNFNKIQESFIHKDVNKEAHRQPTDGSYRKGRQPLEHQHRAIIIHSSAGTPNGDLKSLAGKERSRDPKTGELLYNEDRTPKFRLAGAHFYISKDGKIYLLVGEDKVAFHSSVGLMFDAVDPNSFAFGIELEGYSYEEGKSNEHKNTDFSKNPKLLESLGKVVAYLCNKYNIPYELIQTHYDVDDYYELNFYKNLGFLKGIEGRKDLYGVEWKPPRGKVDIMPKQYAPIKNYLETHVFKKINNEHAFGGYINNQQPVLFKLFKNGGYKDGNDKTKNEKNKTYGPYELPAVIITPDNQYNEFINSLPDNHKYTPEEDYRMYKYWQLWGKPKNFLYTLDNPNEDGDYMFNWDTSDSSYHGSSIAWGDDGVGYFIKPKHHETLKYELDYYNKGLITEEGGIQRPMTPEEQKEWEDFKSRYTLKDDGNFYKYVPKAKGGYISNNPTLALIGKVNKFKEGGYEDENKNINNSILGRYVLSKISQNNLESQELPIIIMEEPVSESTHVELPSLNIQELELLNFLLSDPTIELWYLRDLAIQNMTSPQSDLGVIQTKEEQDLVDKAFLGYDNFRYSHPWAEGLGYTPVIGDAMDLISIAGDVNNKDYMSAGVGLGMLALPNFIEKPLRYVKDFRFSPITNSTFRKKAKELSKRGERLKRSYDMDLKMYEDAASEYNKTYNRDLKDMYYNDYVEVSNLMDKEAISRGYTWAYLLNSNNPFDYTNWSAYRTYTPSLLEKTNLDHVKRYEDYNKIAQLYLSSNGEVKMVGSTLSNAKGVTNSDYLASDIDFLTTKKNAEELSKQYNLRKNMSGTAYVNKLASIAGREMELNAQFIDEDPNGNAVGKLALEYFAIKNPKEYNKFVQDCIDNNKPILETPLPIKSDELFNSINEDDILLRVILDNIGSGHDKHRKRVQRSLLSVDYNTVKKYKQALDNSMESLFGENYKKFTEEFPNIKFDDVEQNKNFLKRIFGDKGYDIEAVAKDPERMEVITEMYYYSYSTSGRHTLGLDNKFEGKVVPADSGLGVSIINPKGSTGGGSVAGGGTNTGLGKAPAGYGNYESVFLLPITYDKSKINNLDDLVNQVEHITSKKSLDLSRLLGSYVGDDISYNSLDKLKHIDEVTREHDIPIVVNENSHINTGYTGVFADADVLRSAKISELDKDVAAIFETPSGMVNAKKLFEPISEFIPLDKWNNSDDLIKALNSKKDELLSKRNELLSELKLDMDNKKDLLESSAHKYDRNHREQQNLKSKFKKLQALETALYIIGGEVLVYGGTKYLTNNKKEGKEIEVNNELLETLDTIASRNYAQSLNSNFPNLAFSHKFEK